MCLARTDWDVPKHRGLTWFAVPTDAEGVTIRQITQINGNAEFCEEFLDDVVVTDDDVIGEVNRGWAVTQTMLVYERGAGESNVAVREPRELAPDLVALARRVGRIDDPIARQAIARAHINDYAQYHLGRRIAARLRASDTPGRRRRRLQQAGGRHVHADAGPPRAGDRRERGAGLGERRRGRAAAGPRLPQRAPDRHRRRHQRDAAQRHRRARPRPAT